MASIATKRNRAVGMIMAATLCSLAGTARGEEPSRLARIVVVGHGSVRTDPDLATLSFNIRGEGATSDAAAAALVRKRKAIADGLSGLLGSTVVVMTGALSILEARDKACDGDDGGSAVRLSAGPCAVRGYVAQVSASLRLSPVTDAGTALGLAARLGASDARLNDYGLRDPANARQRAEAAAIDEARTRARAIAASAGVRLGKLISVEDPQSRSNADDEIVVTAGRRSPAVMPPAPVVIDIRPEPIETSASLTVTYAVE